jgi:hypothetical protein
LGQTQTHLQGNPPHRHRCAYCCRGGGNEEDSRRGQPSESREGTCVHLQTWLRSFRWLPLSCLMKKRTV